MNTMSFGSSGIVDQARRYIGSNPTGQTGWTELVPNGSGLAMAAVDPNLFANDISLYSLGS